MNSNSTNNIICNSNRKTNYYPSDYHLHTVFSGDSENNPENVIKKAISLGMKSICFTDHLDFDYPGDNPDMFVLDIISYIKTMNLLKEKYLKTLDIRIGLETGLEPDKKILLDKYINSFDFDFIIGSSHLVHKKDPYYPEYFSGRTDVDSFMEYFTSILENLNCCSNFDVYGHIDYVVRYSPNKAASFSLKTFGDIVDEILKKIISLEKGIEINTGGYRTGLNTTNPCTDIIKRYKELGGEIITIGSDAHTTEYVGSYFNNALKILNESGFSYYTTFKQRKPEFHKI